MSIRLFIVIFNHTFGLQPVLLFSGAGVDSAWEQRKLEAWKKPENAPESR